MAAEAGQGEFHSVENTLKEKLSEEDYTNVTKVLYGLNQGETVKELPVPRAAKSLAEKGDFDITLHKLLLRRNRVTKE